MMCMLCLKKHSLKLKTKKGKTYERPFKKIQKRIKIRGKVVDAVKRYAKVNNKYLFYLNVIV